MNARPSPRVYPVESMLMAAVVIWAANYPISKYGLSGLGVYVFNGLRFVVAGLFLVVLFLRRFQWMPVARNDWGRLVGLGLLGNVVYQAAFVTGLNITTSGNAAVLLSTSPLWTVFFDARINRQPITAGMLWGMGMSLCGVFLIIMGSGKELGFGGSVLTGDLICLGAAALSGLTNTLQKPYLVRYGVPQLSMIFTVIGAVGLTALAIPSAARTPWMAVHWSYYAAVLASGAFSIAIAGLFWNKGIKELGPGRAANFNNLIPVLAFVFSYLVLGERLYAVQFIGAAATIAGVWYARRSWSVL
jgi:drug/metabolite transporter (DMT)-like permease